MHLARSLTALRLDANSPTPLFRQLYEAVKAAILAGQLDPGTQLPPTREFATLLGVSRQTVLSAFAQLAAEGFLSGAVGRGTFVSDKLPIPRRREDASGSPPQPLRPLSERGRGFVGAETLLNIHHGTPRPFRIGMPGLDVFPFDIWARLEARHWRRPDVHLGYGDPAGYRPLRELLAAYLNASRGVHCAPEQIIITSGSQQALYLIATLLLAPGDAAWVEDPGYRGISASLFAAQARVCPVPVDEQGFCVDAGIADHPDAKLAYVTPSHQYPLGVTMSLQRRLRLLDWAASNKLWIVEDEYDSEYRYTGRPLASLQSLDKAGCVIYVGTLSKVLFPALRLGYLVVPPALADAFAQAKAVLDRHTPVMPQIVLADFIAEGHFSRHIRRTREVYGERRAALLESLAMQLADEIRLGPSDAGLHITGAFTTRRDDQAIVEAALRQGIELRALSGFYAAPAHAPRGLLLGFAATTPEEIRQGVAGLRELLNQARPVRR